MSQGVRVAYIMVWRILHGVMERHNGRRKCGIKKRSIPNIAIETFGMGIELSEEALGIVRNGE